MPDVYAIANEQRAALLAGDKAVKQRLIDAYATVDKDLQKRLGILTDLIERRRAAGQDVSRAWLLREGRYTALLEQVKSETARLAALTAAETTGAARNNLESGTRDALVLIQAAEGRTVVAGSFNRLPTKATANIAAYLDEAAPFGKLMARIGKEMPADAVAAAKNVLLVGVSTGQGPSVIARNFRDTTGESLTRSLTIARTEGLRAYRQASLQTYQDSDLITAWEWLSTKSERSCIACIAQDGKIYDKAAPFPSHVRCRCTSIPIVNDKPRARQTAEEWLREQDQDTQETMMGKAAAKAWRAGEVNLKDFVGQRENRDWGASVYYDSLKAARVRAEERRKAGILNVENDARNGAKSAGNVPRIQVSEARRVELETLAKKELDAIAPLVSEAVGLKSNWSGVVRIDPDLEDYGVKHWECGISLAVETMEGERRRRTQIHEMLHAHSVGFLANDFKNNRGWEEACVEQLQRLIRARVYDSAGFGDAPAYGDATDRQHIYNVYIAAAEKARKFFGDEPLPFYAELLGTPIAARKYVLIKRIPTLPKDRRAEAIDVCGAMGLVLKRDLNLENKLNRERLAVEVVESAAYLFGEQEAL